MAAKRWVVMWLIACAASVFVMILLGGITRLSGAGLSIVEWQPVTGILPPLSDHAWQAEFLKYQHHSEFQKINTYMSLAEFKWIYGLEYFHRLWGRLIGLLVLLPLMFFAWKNMLSRRTILRVLGLFLLGGAQGAVGWLMVKSGLGEDPHVSPFRLTIHLVMASLILLGFVRLAHESAGNLSSSQKWYRHPYKILLGLAFLVLSYGGLVAGHKAGLVYNTFPLMGAYWIPPEIGEQSPFWHNFLFNPVAVQWVHRVLALGLIMSVLGHGIYRGSRNTVWEKMLLGAVLTQGLLGVLTLLYHVPLGLAIAHQGVGVAVLVALMGCISTYRPFGVGAERRGASGL